jgi:hypothetical protein
MKRRRTGLLAVYREIAANDIRRLNWRAMRYFVKRRRYLEAAQCRDRVGTWNRTGPT